MIQNNCKYLKIVKSSLEEVENILSKSQVVQVSRKQFKNSLEVVQNS